MNRVNVFKRNIMLPGISKVRPAVAIPRVSNSRFEPQEKKFFWPHSKGGLAKNLNIKLERLIPSCRIT
jgi:hypothetical protein